MRWLILVRAHFSFLAEYVVRNRRAYYGVLLAGLAALSFINALGESDGDGAGMGTAFWLGLLGVAAPLCRSWVDDDVRLGYGALWIQKPVRPLALYSARLVAVIAWTLLGAVAVAATVGFAGSVGGASPLIALELLLVLGWMPVLLVVLAFLGSSLGARNAALFAYGLFFAGAGLQGIVDSLRLGGVYDLVRRVFPPLDSVVGIAAALEQKGLGPALAQLRPVLVYMLVCAVLAVVLTLRVPGRLARSV